MEYVTLRNGVQMPILGYGVYQIDNEATKRCVLDAIDVGYRSIDTAQAYYNEEGVGEAVAQAVAEGTVKREELFLTTKVWIRHAGYEKAKASIDESLQKLRTDCFWFISPLGIITAHGAPWRKPIKREKRGQSASAIFIPIDLWIWRISARSAPWSIRWKLMCSSSRKRQGRFWRNTGRRSNPGGRLPKERWIYSPIPS